MQVPINFRSNIPLFYNKTNTEFRLDPYERYGEMVIRQMALHLADEIWGFYPFQSVLDFILENISISEKSKIADLGCGVGRLIGELAIRFPQSDCWGIDYSYQMLQQAHRFWISKQSLQLDRTERGFSTIQLHGFNLKNISFGLAKAEALPFDDNTLDIVLSSFLLDRLNSPEDGLKEMYRILKPDSQLLICSPLNFQKRKHWEKFYPVPKLLEEITKIGFTNLKHQTIEIHEPLDLHGNQIVWKCETIVGIK